MEGLSWYTAALHDGDHDTDVIRRLPVVAHILMKTCLIFIIMSFCYSLFYNIGHVHFKLLFILITAGFFNVFFIHFVFIHWSIHCCLFVWLYLFRQDTDATDVSVFNMYHPVCVCHVVLPCRNMYYVPKTNFPSGTVKFILSYLINETTAADQQWRSALPVETLYFEIFSSSLCIFYCKENPQAVI